MHIFMTHIHAYIHDTHPCMHIKSIHVHERLPSYIYMCARNLQYLILSVLQEASEVPSEQPSEGPSEQPTSHVSERFLFADFCPYQIKIDKPDKSSAFCVDDLITSNSLAHYRTLSRCSPLCLSILRELLTPSA